MLLSDIYRGRKGYARLAATLEALAVRGASSHERIESAVQAGLLYYRAAGDEDRRTAVGARVGATSACAAGAP